MDEITVATGEERPDVAFAEVVRKYEDDLSVDQIRALPFFAYGVSKNKIAEYLNVSLNTVNKWWRDPVFKAALEETQLALINWHADMLDRIAVLAWQRLWEILETDYADDDKVGRQEQARTARFIIDSLGLKKRQVEVSHKVEMPELNITESTADIIARRLYELEQNTIEGEVEVLDEFSLSNSGLLACHPDTEYGVLNDKDGKLQCHYCGGWYRDLRSHVGGEHGMTADEYKNAFGLGFDLVLEPRSGGIDEEGTETDNG